MESGPVFKFVVGVWVVWVALTIAVAGTLGYVAYHFISKMW
jgi:hypothetical protein